MSNKQQFPFSKIPGVNRTCGSCDWYDQEFDGDEKQGPQGVCFYNPPTTAAVSIQSQLAAGAAFPTTMSMRPTVQPHHRCAFHEPRKR